MITPSQPNPTAAFLKTFSIGGVELQPCSRGRLDVWDDVCRRMAQPIDRAIIQRADNESARVARARKDGDAAAVFSAEVEKEYNEAPRREFGAEIIAWVFLYALSLPYPKLLREINDLDKFTGNAMAFRDTLTSVSTTAARKLAGEIFDEAQQWRATTQDPATADDEGSEGDEIPKV